MENGFGAFAAMLALFGGTSLVIWTSVQAKIARIKAEAQVRQMSTAPLPEAGITAELKALRQQVAEMSSTGHQFDLSFDEALNRLESRVNRLETKSTVSIAPPTNTAQTLRNGQGQ